MGGPTWKTVWDNLVGKGRGDERAKDGGWFDDRWLSASRESEGFWYDNWKFGAREHWSTNTASGAKQGTFRDTDSKLVFASKTSRHRSGFLSTASFGAFEQHTCG